MADLDSILYIGADVIKPVSVVGVFLDSDLSMRHHINAVIRSCFLFFGVYIQFDSAIY